MSAGQARWTVASGEQSPGTVERLLGLLPAWFGIESSNAHYVESARTMPTYLARPAGSGEVVGVLLAATHFANAAEIYLLAVDPAVHRQGVGRALVEAFEHDLTADGVTLLQVKTLGPSHPDEGYRKTRLFYEGVGFEPLEEIIGLWPENPCLIMVKTLRVA